MDNILNRWKKGLTKTSKATFSQIASLIGTSEINEETFDNLEALLIQADVGLLTSQDIIHALKQRWREENITKNEQFISVLRQELLQRVDAPPALKLTDHPTVILIVGVNGSGKTTTIAKLGSYFLNQSKTVIFGAADTYRAAAVDQLQIWADRLNIPIVTGRQGGDSGAVTFDTIQSAIARKVDVALIDTAGRMHTRLNLMEELKKVYRVAGKALNSAPHAVWLVLDATTGQNALSQAKAFTTAVKADGVILAKLDSSSKGGMVFAIHQELNLPILFAGLGEKVEDLEPFTPDVFVDGLLKN